MATWSDDQKSLKVEMTFDQLTSLSIDTVVTRSKVFKAFLCCFLGSGVPSMDLLPCLYPELKAFYCQDTLTKELLNLQESPDTLFLGILIPLPHILLLKLIL